MSINVFQCNICGNVRLLAGAHGGKPPVCDHVELTETAEYIAVSTNVDPMEFIGTLAVNP